MRHGGHNTKYDFTMEIGETIFVPGTLHLIRTAATMRGTRNGIWLSVAPAEGGANVTRHAKPNVWRVRRQNPKLDERLQKLEDALRFISLMVIKINKKLPEDID